MADDFDGRFYANGKAVLRNPLQVKKPEGGATITMGFRVCTLTEEVSDDAAQTIATALNRMIDSGDIPNGQPKEEA